MPAFEDADASFAAGTPFLQFLKPSALLLCLTLFAGLAVGRDRNSFDAQLLCGGFIGRGKESRIGRQRRRRVAELPDVLLD